MLLIAEQDFSEVFDVVGDEECSDNDCQQMVVYGKFILSAELTLFKIFPKQFN
jgi:hypothetical protein